MKLPKVGVLLYGVFAYVLFLGTFLYTIGFVMGFVVPKQIDTVSGELASTTKAVLVNGGILALFAVQHTIMARHGFKRAIAKLIPPPIERSTFVLVTSSILIALFYFWQPMPEVLWEVHSPLLRNVLHGIALFGFLGVVGVTFLIDHFELFGLKQAYSHFAGRPFRYPSFQVRWLYRFSRHPLYLCFFLGFWAAPTMTVGHLFFAVMCTAYVFVGVQFEERGLIAIHGDAYREYKRNVPAIVPIPGRSTPAIAPTRPEPA